jgi:hypothetical protein
MKNISTGTGIALLAGAIVAYPILDRVMPKADASATQAAAVLASATAQVEPTIVWYQAMSIDVATGTGSGYTAYFESPGFWLVRGWSDGRIEGRFVGRSGAMLSCSGTGVPCMSAWTTISDQNSGYSAASDINFDSKVDGADLGQLLADWGDAPRQDIPPSDCPLALINP